MRAAASLPPRPLRRVYVDTSAWVSLLVHEPSARAIETQLADPNSQLLTAHWTRTELASALAIKSRRGEVAPRQVLQLIEEFGLWVTAGMRLLTPEQKDFEQAAEFCTDVDSGLRAGDALHLAVAKRSSATHLLSLDDGMCRQASKLGLACLEVPLTP